MSQTSKTIFYIIGYYINFFVQSLKHGHLPQFDWKCLQIGTLRAKGIRKNVFILQKGWSTQFPHTQPVIGVVLLLTEAMRKDFWNPTVFIYKLQYTIINTNILLHDIL